MLQGFLPIHADHKILSFEITEKITSLKIIINVLGIIALHITGCFLFASELLRKEKDSSVKAERGSTLQYQKEVSMDQGYLNKENYDQQDEIEDTGNINYKENINSLFDIYLDDYENNPNKIQQKLGNMESILLNNLKEGITGAMCLDPHGEELHDQIFHWQGFDKYELIELYKTNDKLSANLNEGGLCQMLFSDQNLWYLVAKYRGNYLLLQTDEAKPDSLIENSFYLVQAIRQFA